jgi:hypothetical protein
MKPRIAYYLIGAGCGLAAGLLLDLATGRMGRFAGGFVAMGGALAVMIGTRKGKIPPVEEEFRPTTIFPNGIPGKN